MCAVFSRLEFASRTWQINLDLKGGGFPAVNMMASMLTPDKPLVDFDRGVSPFSRDPDLFWREHPLIMGRFYPSWVNIMGLHVILQETRFDCVRRSLVTRQNWPSIIVGVVSCLLTPAAEGHCGTGGRSYKMVSLTHK